jgi:hypothetical protein
MRRIDVLFVVSLIAAASVDANEAPKEWRNLTGEKSIRGTLVKRNADSIVIKRSDNQTELSIPLDKLHPADRAALDQPAAVQSDSKPEREEGVFDNLRFGDTREQVLEKLKDSPIVEAVVDGAFLGRVGMNGSYRFKEAIGGAKPSLFFGWTESGGLGEIFIQTEPTRLAEKEAKLVPCWQVLAELLTETHGAPLKPAEPLTFDGLDDGIMKPTHFWKLEPEGSIQLGRARDGESYQVVARFSLDPVVFIPKPTSP